MRDGSSYTDRLAATTSLSLSTRLFVGLNPSTKQAIGAMARHAILRPSCLRASLAAPPPLPPPASLPT